MATNLKEQTMNQTTMLDEPIDGEIVGGQEPSTALATRELSPMSLIEAAITQGVDTDKLEKLLELQERWERNEERKEARRAEIAFSEAMATCQAECQAVVAKHYNKQTESKYADLFDMDLAIRPVYTRHGFSLSFGTSRSEMEKHVHVYCDVRHKNGHTCRYEDDFPIDDAGIKGTINKTPIQAKGSTTSYAQRYLTKGIFNIVVQGEDNDGNGAGDPINETQLAALDAELQRIAPDDRQAAIDAVFKWAGIDNLADLPASKYQGALAGLMKRSAKYQQ
jgi:hypothetical protein